uniref:VWFA domain-containing protein n=1 Tax=Heterorhabditis bacteriophora TaxID=37862 RepID=A0A1I7X5V0_HETBA
MTGEKNIYRRRIDKLPEPGTPQIKPKKMRLCFDISGSMYRFNGHDKRLQKSLEAALMVMSSLEGQDQKIKVNKHFHSYIMLIFIRQINQHFYRLQKALPAGKAFVCKDTSELPSIMQNIFASTLV